LNLALVKYKLGTPHLGTTGIDISVLVFDLWDHTKRFRLVLQTMYEVGDSEHEFALHL